MTNYDYQKNLEALWTTAVKRYAEGRRGAKEFFTPEEQAFMASIGATPQEVYDFAEDAHNDNAPDFTTFALIHDIRRSYFLEVQKGRRSGHILDKESLPGVMDEASGIRWLPRILAKAKAKLRGELPADIMYGCGGDRRFLQIHDIHPAEFLRIVWANENDDQAIIDWVGQRFSNLKASDSL